LVSVWCAVSLRPPAGLNTGEEFAHVGENAMAKNVILRIVDGRGSRVLA
jgi:hypothetical protein